MTILDGFDNWSVFCSRHNLRGNQASHSCRSLTGPCCTGGQTRSRPCRPVSGLTGWPWDRGWTLNGFRACSDELVKAAKSPFMVYPLRERHRAEPRQKAPLALIQKLVARRPGGNPRPVRRRNHSGAAEHPGTGSRHRDQNAIADRRPPHVARSARAWGNATGQLDLFAPPAVHRSPPSAPAMRVLAAPTPGHKGGVARKSSVGHPARFAKVRNVGHLRRPVTGATSNPPRPTSGGDRPGEQRARVLAEIGRAGRAGLTCKELAERWGVGMNAISGRFTELRPRATSGRRWTTTGIESCGTAVPPGEVNMGAKTGINWTDSTWNPIRGCSPVSQGVRGAMPLGWRIGSAGLASHTRGWLTGAAGGRFSTARSAGSQSASWTNRCGGSARAGSSSTPCRTVPRERARPRCR